MKNTQDTNRLIMKNPIYWVGIAIMYFILCLFIGQNITFAASNDVISKDLYKKTYDEIKNKPTENTLKNISNQSGFSQDEVRNIVTGADLSAIIKKYPNLSQQELYQKFSELASSYERELSMQSLKQEIESTIKPSEIYSDGDLTNSDFDLLFDLQIIEIILFRDSTPSAFGGQFNLPSNTKKEIENELLGIGPEGEGGDDGDGIGGGEVSGDDDSGLDGDETSDEGINPLACLDGDSSLSDALNDYSEREEDEADDGAGDEDGTDGDADGGGDEDSGEGDEDEDDPLEADPDDWPYKSLCPNDIPFCIEINFAISQAQSYQPKNNCVACHVTMINETLQKVLGHPLSPNKLTGNLMEVPKCKKGITTLPLDMNIITVAVPAVQPANQDIYKKANIDDEWQRVMEMFSPFSYQQTDEANTQNQSEIAQTSEDLAFKKALNNLSPTGSIEEFNSRSSQIYSSQQNQQNQIANQTVQQNQGSDKNLYYQTIINELNNMDNYFKGFKKKIEEMKEPCTSTQNKPSC